MTDEERVQIFVAELDKTTGVSKRFLDAARPAVEKLFRSVPPEKQAEVLEVFRQTARCQAETEHHASAALAMTEDLAEKEAAFARKLKELRKRIDRTHAGFAYILFSTCGGFGEPRAQVAAEG